MKRRGQPFQKGGNICFKLYCMDIRLLVAIVGRQTSTLILNNFICCTMLRALIKSVNRRILPGLALIRDRGTGGQWGHVPHHFFKSEKMPFGGARRKCPFCSSKDSVKAISDFIGTPYFSKIV